MTVAVRGHVWRSGLPVLERAGLLANVLAAVPTETAALFRNPPPITAWVPIAHMDAVTDALSTLGGDELVRRISRDGGRDAQPAPLRALVRLLRLGGAGPHVLLARLGDLSKLQVRGVTVGYERVGPREARLTLTYEDSPPHSRLVGMAGRFESLLDLAGAAGTVSAPAPSPGSNAYAFLVRW